jgi:hypothetical protein
MDEDELKPCTTARTEARGATCMQCSPVRVLASCSLLQGQAHPTHEPKALHTSCGGLDWDATSLDRNSTNSRSAAYAYEYQSWILLNPRTSSE